VKVSGSVEKQLWSREMSVKGLIQAYRVAQDAKTSTGMTAAVKELNNMHGFNEPTKLSITGSSGYAHPYAK
jgi:hypothetical protein